LNVDFKVKNKEIVTVRNNTEKKTGLLNNPLLMKKINTICYYMKKREKISLLMIMSLMLFPKFLSGQCTDDVFLDKCAANLGTFNYIKSFVAYANPRKKANNEYTYVLSKGSTYIIIICDENINGGKMDISLYNMNHDLIASTYNEIEKKHYQIIQFPCSATGVYYLRATFEGTKKGCGLCILGFNKD
jgi:hypothetical protein